MKNSYIILILCVGLLSGCRLINRHSDEVVAELGEHRLLRSDLQAVTMGLNGEDSVRAAEQYILQWAGDILIYEEAKEKNDAHIEALVEDYRRSLYVYRYQQQYIAQRMPAQVHDTIIDRFYQEHCDQLVLDQTIVKGLLLVLPNAAPDRDKLRRWLERPDEHMEQIEKYAYGNASGYELFMDQWLSVNQILMRIPFSENTLRQQLRNPMIEMQDSVSTYMVRVTDRAYAGEPMPADYARAEIIKTILAQRQVEWLARQRDQLYHNALLLKKLRIYEE